MLQYLESYKGSLTIGDRTYASVAEAMSVIGNQSKDIRVLINAPKAVKADPKPVNKVEKHVEVETENSTIYFIKVRQYMTKPATDAFDFHRKFNNDSPMPMRMMVGKILQETKGMVKMECWAELLQKQMQSCMSCGRPITNPVSRYFGLGPECGGHNYTHPFANDAELRAAVDDFTSKKLSKIKWTGWIIKSAIEEQSVLREE